jgi:hypothetical protein
LVVRQASNAKDLADLMRALASLAWPGVAILAMYWFRSEIRSLLGRIRKGKFLGNEFELDALESKAAEAETTAELQAEGKMQVDGIIGRAAAAQDEQTVHAAGTVTSPPDQRPADRHVDDVVEEVLKEAGRYLRHPR